MKYLIAVFFILSVIMSAYTQAAESNYFLTIDGEKIPLSLDKEVSYKLSSGESIIFKLSQPEELFYSDNMVSFKYPKNFSISNSIIEEGIEQCAVLNSKGNGFMVQKYETLNPDFLTMFMLNEITKESISYGYEIEKQDFIKALPDGKKISGIKAILTYRGEKEEYTVASYGDKDQGVIILTMLLNEDDKVTDEKIIDLFLNTLTIKL